ncbi:PiggyBac transposable element-derived protein 4 [Elysia marginata]|uniref:PiggyBac transposable element-derived protein 4 n=1 Tax=Elysia marginata TaxID=1093978 RepID=A0AAV4JYD8_9GAST|nr:PiggyBac transposable element-derived protein 4 [Elysia marginata]
MERENIFHHFDATLAEFELRNEDGDFVNEPEEDRASESEGDAVPFLSSDDDIDSDDCCDIDEPNLATLQPVGVASLISCRPGTSSDPMVGAIASTPSSSEAPDDVTPSLPDDIHGFYKAKDETVWCKSVPPPTGIRSSNIFRPPVRQVRNPKNLYTVCDAYTRFINARMVQKVVCCTNLEGERVCGENWVKTHATEIEGFLGCLLHLGALRDNRTPTTVLWDKTNRNKLLRACFSRNRFLKLSNHLRFDDKSTRQSRRAKDVFSPFREIWDDFNLNLGKEYIPGPMLTVVEQLMP